MKGYIVMVDLAITGTDDYTRESYDGVIYTDLDEAVAVSGDAELEAGVISSHVYEIKLEVEA